MLNVMLVDDNKNVLEGLEILIDWKSLGFRVVKTARNGFEALEYVTQEKIDIVVTDIRMPKMSGIELVEQIRKISGDIKCIIISAYNEFEYAQKAMVFGVRYYLTKPVKKQDLIDALNSIKNNDFEKEASSHQHSIVNMLRQDKKVVYNQEIKPDNSHVRFAVIYPLPENGIVLQPTSMVEKRTDTIFEAIKTPLPDWLVFAAENERCGIDVLIKDEYSDYYTAAQRLEKHIAERTNIPFCLLIGKKVRDTDEANSSRKTIHDNRNEYFYCPERKLIIYEEIKHKYYVTEYNSEITQNIVSAAGKHDSVLLKGALDVFVNNLKNDCVTPEIFITAVYNILFELTTVFSKDDYEVIKYINILSNFQKNYLCNIRMLTDFLMQSVEETHSAKARRNTMKDLGTVGAVLKYIDENYADSDLRLNILANKYYMNTIYLGQIFKNKTGKSFNTYLLEYRIEKAKEYLRNTNCKIYSIAKMVGFSNSNYFATKFLEIVGETPTDYRENFRK